MGATPCKPCCKASDQDHEDAGLDAKLLIGDDRICFGAVNEQKSTSSTNAPAVPFSSEEEYSIVLDKGAGGKLGIDVDYVAERDTLPIRAVTGDLVREWNAANPTKMVAANDHIIEVNGDCKVVDLLMERLRHDSVLKIRLSRRRRSAVCHLTANGKPCRSASGSESLEKGATCRGSVRLTHINPDVCRIEYEIHGLNPGKHGFYIHEKANFSDGGTTTGPHYNPFGKTHGSPDNGERHVGDLGNIEADVTGVAAGVISDHLVKLYGEYSVIGRSVHVHEGSDDPGRGDSIQVGPPPVNGRSSKITGNAGAHIVCGEIVLVE